MLFSYFLLMCVVVFIRILCFLVVVYFIRILVVDYSVILSSWWMLEFGLVRFVVVELRVVVLMFKLLCISDKGMVFGLVVVCLVKYLSFDFIVILRWRYVFFILIIYVE